MMLRSASEPALADEPKEPSASLARRLLPKLAISLVLGGLFAWLVARGGVPLIPPASAFQRVAWWTIPTYALVLCVTHIFRASRWRFLIAPVKRLHLREVIALNWIGFFAIFALPLRLGELARPALTKMRQGIPLSVGIGTVAVERVVDGLITSLCVAWALFALPRRNPDDHIVRHLPMYGYVSLAVFTAALCALALFLWQRNLAVRLVQRTIGIFSDRLSHVLAEKVGSIADGIRSISQPKLAAGFAAETFVYWATNAFGMWLLAYGCGLPIGFSHAIGIMGILALGILLPAGPGLFGNFQLAMSAALKLYLATSLVGTQGAVYIFLLYGIQALLIVTAGVIPLYAMRIRVGTLLRATTASSDSTDPG